MTKIKIFALGGLGENGKNTFVVEVGNELFVLDMGIKYPDESLLGIDLVYSDFSYLYENKDRIQGIFLSSGHEDHLGAVSYFLKDLTSVPVFATHFTISVLEEMFTEQGLDYKKYKFYRINDQKELTFKEATVQFYNVAHSIPETCHIAINTREGVIVYAPDYTFDFSKDKRYKISFDKIMKLAEKKVIAVLTESLGVNNDKRPTTDNELDHNLTEAFLTKKRIICTCFSSDIKRIQKIINEAISFDRKVAILGRRAQKLVSIAIELGYLEVPQGKVINLKPYDEFHKNESDDLVIIVAGSRHEPYYMLQRMAKNQDRFIHLKEKDICILLTPPISETEVMAQQTLSLLSKKGISLISMTKQNLKGHHANENDLKMLWNMLKPHYIIPIIGEYRHQYGQKEIALKSGFNDSQILLIQNGEVLEYNGNNFKKLSEKVFTGDVLVDGNVISDSDEQLLKDRQKLSNDGVIFSIVLVDKDAKSLQDVAIRTKGLGDSLLIERELKILIRQNVISHLNKGFVDIINLKRLVNQTIWDYVSKGMHKHPIIAVDVFTY